MQKWMWLLGLLLTLMTSPSMAGGKALLLDVDGAIGPATQDYITRSIHQAEILDAKVIIIQLNTPGGLETSMRGINKVIVSSPIPVITYVSPSGAHAASAGTFIMYASNFAAMAPGTNIGAATPVKITPEEKTNAALLDSHEKKAMNDAAAYLRSLAYLRDRNVEWADLAVMKAVSISAEEAKKINVINFIANDIPDLLAKVNGKKTQILNQTMVMDTKNLEIQTLAPDWRNQFLSFITDPNIAYLLMLLALYGIFFEFTSPGMVLPGVAGVIALLLALYAFQLMPINYVGLSLICLGVLFMVFEVYISSFGILGLGGIIAFIVGSIMLYDTNDPNFHITTTLVLTMATITTAFFFVIVMMTIRSFKQPIVTGHHALIGSEGTVIYGGQGKATIMLMGEIWNAESGSVLTPGQHVKVIKTNELTLIVEPLNKQG